jgi:hypothetical protein
MENAGIENAEGVNFSVPRKSEMASLLKQRMMNKQIYYPLLNWERPYRGDLCTELNVERYQLRKDGFNEKNEHKRGKNNPASSYLFAFQVRAQQLQRLP